MAARKLRPRQSEEVRARIQSSQLINRLENHAFGDIELTSTQLKAIEILLKKSLPDLSAIEHSTDPEAPMKMEFGWAKQ